LFSSLLPAQEDPGPYYLSLKKEILYAGSGLLGTATGLYLKQNVPAIGLDALGRPSLLDIDELDLFEDEEEEADFDFAPKVAGQLSDLTLFTSVGLPTLLLSHRKTRRDFGRIGVLYLETMLINQALTDIAKYTVRRPRPFVWKDDFVPDTPLSSNDRASFFSGHTSGAAAASFFFARVFTDYFPDSRLKPYVWGAAATLPAVTGYLRVKAEKHYPTDVMVGYVLGAAIGYLVPTLHRPRTRERRLKISPGVGGLNLFLDF
jgi:membrane-associated phospholipid phosphatase